MQKFYKDISGKYDQIFPSNKKKLSMLLESAKLANSKKVLDIACATGKEALFLVQNSFDVIGIDITKEMVDAAKKRGLCAYEMNMLDIYKLEDNFDFIFCIGNTIPHLDSYIEVQDFFKKVYDKLNVGGVFLLQNINFDNFDLKNKKEGEFVGALPDINNARFNFYRSYYKRGEKIGFNTKLDLFSAVYENEVLLIPLSSKVMEDLLFRIGFSNIEIFGGFDKKSLNESEQIVLRCRK